MIKMQIGLLKWITGFCNLLIEFSGLLFVGFDVMNLVVLFSD